MWVIALLAGLVVLFVLLLSVPIDAVFSLNTSDSPKFRMRLVWLFGLIGKDMSKKEKMPERKEKPPKMKPEKKSRIGFTTALKILRTKGLIKRIINLIKGILRQFKLRELVINLNLGLDNPADAGFAFAMVGVTSPVINRIRRCQVNIKPYYHDEFVFEGHLRGVVRLQPISLAWPVLRFIFSLAALRVLKIMVLSKWKRKK